MKKGGEIMQNINIVGEKPIVTQAIGIALNIVIDIWWAVSYGVDIIFWIFVAITAVQVVQAVITLQKSISVEDQQVVINGEAIPYSNIAGASTPKSFLSQKRVDVSTNDGKSYRIPANNAQAVCDAILTNMANVNNA